MTLATYIVLITILVMIVALVKDAMRPGLIIFSAAVMMMVLGIITPDELVAGFSNKGMLTVAALFLVSEGVRYSGALNKLANIALPKKKRRIPRLLLSIMVPISGLSAFLNNTPVVIIFGPVIKEWSEKLGISSKKFLIPLSYATIFGGICTLIGTSTNLVVDGMMQDAGFEGLGMFELGKIGFAIALVGFLYVSLIGHLLLPDSKKQKNSNRLNEKEYYYSLSVTRNSKYIGEIIKNGQLNDFNDITVMVVERDGVSHDCNADRVILKENDTLLVRGYNEDIESVLHLSGLKINTQGDIDTIIKQENLHRIEVVLAPRFPELVQHWKNLILLEDIRQQY